MYKKPRTTENQKLGNFMRDFLVILILVKIGKKNTVDTVHNDSIAFLFAS